MTAGMGYRLVRVMIRVLLWVFYHRVAVIGRERIPLRGPLIVVANHHNAAVDAMLIVATFPRPIYPLFWTIEGALFWWLAGGRGLVVFVMLLAPAGLVALGWRDRLARVGRQARAVARFLADRDLHRRLLAERRMLVEELTALAGLVPDAVRRGRSDRER
jgi:1-acyl-sn-glycerol-3-phosphate acyltransferase